MSETGTTPTVPSGGPVPSGPPQGLFTPRRAPSTSPSVTPPAVAAPRPAPDRPAATHPSPLPVQRRGPLPADRPLTGGELPAAVLAGLTAELSAEERSGATGVPRRKAIGVAAVGAIAVLVILLTVMAVAGRLL